MPGKINPSIPEMVNQVCFQVMGMRHDASRIAAEHGQLELNVMMPVIAHNVLLVDDDPDERRARRSPRRRVQGIEANASMCAYWVERSAALATALAPQIGYARAAELSKQSVKENVLIRDLVKREHVLPDEEIGRRARSAEDDRDRRAGRRRTAASRRAERDARSRVVGLVRHSRCVRYTSSDAHHHVGRVRR